MLPPVSGTTTPHVAVKPYGSLIPKRVQVRRPDEDVFFSNQSYRARLSQFLSQKPEKPIMFSFAPPDLDSIWNRIVPALERDVLVITPVESAPLESEPKPKTEDPLPALESSLDPATAELIDDPILMEDDDSLLIGQPALPRWELVEPASNPFHSTPSISNTVFSLEDSPIKSVKPDIALNVQHLYGSYVRPEYFNPLEQAYSKAQVLRNQPAWVVEDHNGIAIIPQAEPHQAGYATKEHRWLGRLWSVLAKLLSPLLGLSIDQNQVMFPNGAQLPLTPKTWIDSTGQPVKVFQAVGLPDGTWMKLKSIHAEETFSYKDQKRFRKLVENKIHQLEKEGKLRDIPPGFTGKTPLFPSVQADKMYGQPTFGFKI